MNSTSRIQVLTHAHTLADFIHKENTCKGKCYCIGLFWDYAYKTYDLNKYYRLSCVRFAKFWFIFFFLLLFLAFFG